MSEHEPSQPFVQSLMTINELVSNEVVWGTKKSLIDASPVCLYRTSNMVDPVGEGLLYVQSVHPSPYLSPGPIARLFTYLELLQPLLQFLSLLSLTWPEITAYTSHFTSLLFLPK